MKLIYVAILGLIVLMSACSDPAANKPKAQVADPVTNAPPPASPQVEKESRAAPPSVLKQFKAEGTNVPITPVNSKIEFTGSKVTGKHDGGFKSFDGFIDLVGEKPESSRVVIEIEMSSVFTDADGLTKHLMDSDFFEILNHPKSTFVSTSITPASGGNYTVKGDLTLRGVKKSITFPAAIKVASDMVSVNADFSINRKDFGIVYDGKADDLIRDAVVIRFDIKAARNR